MTATSAAASVMTVQKRGAAATRRVRQALLQNSDAVRGTGDMEGLFDDGTLLGTALAEAVIEEMERDATLRAQVRAHYTDLVALKTAAAFNRFAQAPAAADITPIRRVEGRTIAPFASPDPDFLCYVFGKAQLATVLRRYTLERLKEAAATLEARYPGTRPAHRGRMDAGITYIVEPTDEQQL